MGDKAEPYLQDRSQEDGDACQDEDHDSSHPLFPGGHEHTVRCDLEDTRQPVPALPAFLRDLKLVMSNTIDSQGSLVGLCLAA